MTAAETQAVSTQAFVLERCSRPGQNIRAHPNVDMGYVSEDGAQYCFVSTVRSGLVPRDFLIRGRRYAGAWHTAHPCVFIAKLVGETV